MSRSMFGARQIGALFAFLLAFALFAILVSVGRAVAGPADRDPLFAQCGLENLLPAPANSRGKERIAVRKQKEEGRSAIAFQRWLASAPPALPGLLAFDVDRREWPTEELLGADEPTARYCPSGAQL